MAIIGLLLLSASSAATRPNTFHPDPCHGQTTSSAAFARFAASVWRLPLWERQRPKAKTIASAHHQIYCARGSGKRGELKQQWRDAQRAFYAHRSAMLFRERVLPFYGCTTFSCHAYAIPTQYVDCESGGLGGPYPNIYGIISPTWGNYGGYRYAGSAEEATFREQSLIARAIYEDVGGAAWSPFEGGCS